MLSLREKMKPRTVNSGDDGALLSFADMIAVLFAIFILAYNLNIVKSQLEKESHFQGAIKDTYILKDNLLFERGSAEIKKSGEELLVSLAVDSILQNSNFVKNNAVLMVQGFTDNTPIRTFKFPSNWELSTQRAVNVVKLLVEKGNIPPNRIAASGFSEFYPNAPNETEDGKAANRTIKITIIDRNALKLNTYGEK